MDFNLDELDKLKKQSGRAAFKPRLNVKPKSTTAAAAAPGSQVNPPQTQGGSGTAAEDASGPAAGASQQPSVPVLASQHASKQLTSSQPGAGVTRATPSSHPASQTKPANPGSPAATQKQQHASVPQQGATQASKALVGPAVTKPGSVKHPASSSQPAGTSQLARQAQAEGQRSPSQVTAPGSDTLHKAGTQQGVVHTASKAPSEASLGKAAAPSSSGPAIQQKKAAVSPKVDAHSRPDVRKPTASGVQVATNQQTKVQSQGTGPSASQGPGTKQPAIRTATAAAGQSIPQAGKPDAAAPAPRPASERVASGAEAGPSQQPHVRETGASAGGRKSRQQAARKQRPRKRAPEADRGGQPKRNASQYALSQLEFLHQKASLAQKLLTATQRQRTLVERLNAAPAQDKAAIKHELSLVVNQVNQLNEQRAALEQQGAALRVESPQPAVKRPRRAAAARPLPRDHTSESDTAHDDGSHSSDDDTGSEYLDDSDDSDYVHNDRRKGKSKAKQKGGKQKGAGKGSKAGEGDDLAGAAQGSGAAAWGGLLSVAASALNARQAKKKAVAIRRPPKSAPAKRKATQQSGSGSEDDSGPSHVKKRCTSEGPAEEGGAEEGELYRVRVAPGKGSRYKQRMLNALAAAERPIILPSLPPELQERAILLQAKGAALRTAMSQFNSSGRRGSKGGGSAAEDQQDAEGGQQEGEGEAGAGAEGGQEGGVGAGGGEGCNTLQLTLVEQQGQRIPEYLQKRMASVLKGITPKGMELALRPRATRLPVISADAEVDTNTWSLKHIIARTQAWDRKQSAKERSAADRRRQEAQERMSRSLLERDEDQVFDPDAEGGDPAGGGGDGQNDAEEGDDWAGAAQAAPRVRVGEDGELLIDDASLKIAAQQTKVVRYQRVEEDSNRAVNANTYMKRSPSERWSEEDTNLFYRSLRAFGTDFTLIAQLFPSRDRRNIKNKFNREEREFPDEIRDALHPKSVDAEDKGKLLAVIKARLQSGKAQPALAAPASQRPLQLEAPPPPAGSAADTQQEATGAGAAAGEEGGGPEVGGATGISQGRAGPGNKGQAGTAGAGAGPSQVGKEAGQVAAAAAPDVATAAEGETYDEMDEEVYAY